MRTSLLALVAVASACSAASDLPAGDLDVPGSTDQKADGIAQRHLHYVARRVVQIAARGVYEGSMSATDDGTDVTVTGDWLVAPPGGGLKASIHASGYVDYFVTQVGFLLSERATPQAPWQSARVLWDGQGTCNDGDFDSTRPVRLFDSVDLDASAGQMTGQGYNAEGCQLGVAGGLPLAGLDAEHQLGFFAVPTFDPGRIEGDFAYKLTLSAR